MAPRLYDTLLLYVPNWLVFALLGIVGGAIAYIISHWQFMRQVRSGYREQVRIKDEIIAALRAETPQNILATLQRIEDKLDRLTNRQL